MVLLAAIINFLRVCPGEEEFGVKVAMCFKQI